jgi:hypothetical protein
VTRAARQAEKRGAVAPASAPLSQDNIDLSAIPAHAAGLYAARDPLAAARAVGDGCRNQSRGGRVTIAAQMVERMFRNDPTGLDQCLTYLSRLRSQRPAA